MEDAILEASFEGSVCQSVVDLLEIIQEKFYVDYRIYLQLEDENGERHEIDLVDSRPSELATEARR